MKKLLILLVLLFNCVEVKANEYFIGIASWYGPGFHGRKTASGAIFDQNKLTAAHKKLPFGTKLKVTNLKNNKFTYVIINDVGPFWGKRVLDLSKRAAEEIDMIGSGIAKVKCEIIKYGKRNKLNTRKICSSRR